MSTEHTPERLEVADDGSLGSIVSESGMAIAQTFETSAKDRLAGSPVRKANARRLVACWNACEGAQTEWLEQNKPVKELADAIRDAQAQRDELLGALKQMVIAFRPPEHDSERDAHLREHYPEWVNARAAIAKAEGKS